MWHYRPKTARAHYKVKVKRQFHRTYGKLLKNSSVLSERLKVSNDGVEVTDDVSKAFQASAATARKARPPIVGRRVDGVSSLSVAADLKCRRDSMSATRVSSRARYDGVSPCRQRYESIASLYVIRWPARNQCNSSRRGVTWSYFLAANIRRAAAFITDCSLSKRQSGMPASIELP
jgi:hypothetical protein